MTDHARHEIDVATIRARNEAIYIVGISMGGMVALDWAQRYPDELRGLVLINSSAGNQPLSWRLQPSAWLRMIHALIASSNEREAAVLSLVSNNRDDYPLHIKQWRNIQLQRPVTRKTILTMLRAAARFHPHHECTVAGLVIASEQDRMVSVRASNDIARQFNWPIIHHPCAGHDLPMDNPQWLAGKIAQWIRRQNDQTLVTQTATFGNANHNHSHAICPLVLVDPAANSKSCITPSKLRISPVKRA